MTAHLAAAFTSPRNRNRLLPISTLLQVPKSGKPELVERPPHPDPLPASGEKEQ